MGSYSVRITASATPAENCAGCPCAPSFPGNRTSAIIFRSFSMASIASFSEVSPRRIAIVVASQRLAIFLDQRGALAELQQHHRERRRILNGPLALRQ